MVHGIVLEVDVADVGRGQNRRRVPADCVTVGIGVLDIRVGDCATAGANVTDTASISALAAGEVELGGPGANSAMASTTITAIAINSVRRKNSGTRITVLTPAMRVRAMSVA